MYNKGKLLKKYNTEAPQNVARNTLKDKIKNKRFRKIRT